MAPIRRRSLSSLSGDGGNGDGSHARTHALSQERYRRAEANPPLLARVLARLSKEGSIGAHMDKQKDSDDDDYDEDEIESRQDSEPPSDAEDNPGLESSRKDARGGAADADTGGRNHVGKEIHLQSPSLEKNGTRTSVQTGLSRLDGENGLTLEPGGLSWGPRSEVLGGTLGGCGGGSRVDAKKREEEDQELLDATVEVERRLKEALENLVRNFCFWVCICTYWRFITTLCAIISLVDLGFLFLFACVYSNSCLFLCNRCIANSDQ